MPRNGLHMLVPEEGIGPESHGDRARLLDHPFQKPANLPFYLSFAAMESAKDPIGTNGMRGKKLRRLKKLADGRGNGRCRIPKARAPDHPLLRGTVARLANHIAVHAGLPRSRDGGTIQPVPSYCYMPRGHSGKPTGPRGRR